MTQFGLKIGIAKQYLQPFIMNLPIQAFLANFHIGCDPSSGFGIVSYFSENADIKKRLLDFEALYSVSKLLKFGF